MGSRLILNPSRIFECLVEVEAPENIDSVPKILKVHPENYKETKEGPAILQQIPVFCFPYDISSCNPAGQLFTFVWTNMESMFLFGFCRHPPGAKTCLCVISYLPWYEIFYKFLNTLGEMTCKKQYTDVRTLLEALYIYPVPEPLSEVTITTEVEGIRFTFTTPDPIKLPTIPESRNLTEYYNAIDPTIMMTVFASLLYERRIIVTSKKLSLLTACIPAAVSLMYPLIWQHLYIPVLPNKLLDYCGAPMPFFVGVHSSLMTKVRKMISDQKSDIVIVDVDNNKIETPFEDLESLPSEILSLLKHRLKRTDKLLGEGVARAFLKALVPLLSCYRNALKLNLGEKISFDKDLFVQSTKSSRFRNVLENVTECQHFAQFIAGRLDMLNSGKGFNDIFELECDLYDKDKDKWKNTYTKWSKQSLTAMKEFGRKANPVMHNIYKHVNKQVNDTMRKMQPKKENEDTKKGKSKGTEDIPTRSNCMSLEYLDISQPVAQRSVPNSPILRPRFETLPSKSKPPDRPPPPFALYSQAKPRKRSDHVSHNQKFMSSKKEEIPLTYNLIAIGDDVSTEPGTEEDDLIIDDNLCGQKDWNFMDDFNVYIEKLDKGLMNANSDSSEQRGRNRYSLPASVSRQHHDTDNDAFYRLSNLQEGAIKEEDPRTETKSAIDATRNQWEKFEDSSPATVDMKVHAKSSDGELIDLASPVSESVSQRPMRPKVPPPVPPRPASVVRIQVTATSPKSKGLPARPPPPASVKDSTFPSSFSSPSLFTETQKPSVTHRDLSSTQELLADYGINFPSGDNASNPTLTPTMQQQQQQQPQPLCFRNNLPDILNTIPSEPSSCNTPVLQPTTSPKKDAVQPGEDDPFAFLVKQTRQSMTQRQQCDADRGVASRHTEMHTGL
ncbi:DENN domain-containing protein 1B-like [Saccoglossus kowalevskii]